MRKFVAVVMVSAVGPAVLGMGFGCGSDAGTQGPQGEQGIPGARGEPGTSSWTDGAGQVTTEVNVGIGVGADPPQASLHVDGDIRGNFVASDGTDCPNGLILQKSAGGWICGSIAGSGWELAGNAGTTAGANFIGTTDNVPLEIKVNDSRVLRLEPTDSNIPNIIGGSSVNTVAPGVVGGTICGGGPYDPLDTENTNSRVYDDYGTVGGGGGNRVGSDDGDSTNAIYATVAGGVSNQASDDYATVGGGDGNQATGYVATIPGGANNNAAGGWSFAAGRRAQANNDGCFVWGDSTNDDIACNDNNRTVFRSTGGFYIYTDNAVTPAGLYLAAGGSAWNIHSDRAAKENFQPVDTRQLLARLAQIPVTTWNYRSQDPTIRHLGPMAQDFNALHADLGGEGETHINTLDADGVSLAAIQGLYQLVQELQQQNEELHKQLAKQNERLAQLEKHERRWAGNSD